MVVSSIEADPTRIKETMSANDKPERKEPMTETHDVHLQDLKESPLFQLSLASRELFHSNFIYWLGTFEGKVLKRVVCTKVDEINSDEWYIEKVLREKNHMDIVIEFKASPGKEFKVVIENKVKRPPEIAQLNGYTEKTKEPNLKRLLLTMIPFSKKDEVQAQAAGWSQYAYKDFIKDLKVASSDIEDEYHKSLVKDYCKFTGTLAGLLDVHGSDTSYFLAGDLRKKLEALRIDDLFKKHQGYRLSVCLRDKLPKAGVDEKKVKVTDKYFRKDVVCSIRWGNPEKEGERLIQLDGSAINLAVLAKPEVAKALAEKDWDDNWWGLKSEELDEEKGFHGRTKTMKKSINQDGLYEFNEKSVSQLFLYKKRKLTDREKTSSVEEIADIMMGYFNRVKDKIDP